MVLNSQALIQRRLRVISVCHSGITKYSGLPGCEAVPLVQRFPAFRKAIMSSYSGSSSPRTDSLTLYMKELLRSEKAVCVHLST